MSGSDFPESNLDIDPFGMAVAFEGEQAVVRVQGEADLVSAPHLAAVLRGLVESGHARLIVDVGAAGFVGLAGLDAIAETGAIVRARGGSIFLRAATSLVRRVVEMTDLAEDIAFEPPTPALLDVSTQPGSGEIILQELTGREGAGWASRDELRLVSSMPAASDLVDGLLRFVIGLLEASVSSASAVSVSLWRHGQLVTAAASDEAARDADGSQYRAGEGPCVEASSTGEWVVADDLNAERRWPEFVRRAVELGLDAVMSAPLISSGRPAGALNVYSRPIKPFSPPDRDLVSDFSAQLGTLLDTAGVAVADSDVWARIAQALTTREVLAQAQGIVMEREGIGAFEAFAVLRRQSVSGGRPVAELAREIVASIRPPPKSKNYDE